MEDQIASSSGPFFSQYSLPGAHLRGDGGIAHGQIFDEHTRRGHTVREEGTEFFLIHKPIDGHAEIEVRRRIEFGQRAHALLQPTKVSGGVRRAPQSNRWTSRTRFRGGCPAPRVLQ